MITKKILFTCVFALSLLTYSCKTDSKKTTNSEKKYSIEPLTTKVNWTAYKTTDKVAVKGEFNKVNANKKTASTAKEALNGLEFSIPVSSIFSNNEDRDTKLKQFFFGIMDATELLTGTLNITSDTEGSANLKMNGITHSFPITYVISGQLVTIEGVLNLEDWNGQEAIASLNKVCGELHKGADGESKTWNEVKIDIATYLKVE